MGIADIRDSEHRDIVFKYRVVDRAGVVTDVQRTGGAPECQSERLRS